MNTFGFSIKLPSVLGGGYLNVSYAGEGERTIIWTKKPRSSVVFPSLMNFYETAEKSVDGDSISAVISWVEEKEKKRSHPKPTKAFNRLRMPSEERRTLFFKFCNQLRSR